MYKDTLVQIGLSDKEALIYEAMLELGPSPAGVLIKKTGLKRGNLYDILYGLVKKGVIEQVNKGKIANFQALPPENLNKLLESKKYEIESGKKTLENALSSLKSLYTLTTKKPIISYFEGLEGAVKIGEDNLKSKTEICTYADLEAIEKFIPEINAEYIKKRTRLGLKKRGILLDTSFTRKYLDEHGKDIPDTRLIPGDTDPFRTVVTIYDNKVSFLTLSDQGLIGMIIEDQNIYRTHQYLFDFVWREATQIQIKQP